MPVTWFCFLAFLAVGWIIVDGYDFGLGIVYLGIAHSGEERKQALKTITPLWDGNQVWLISLGAAMVFSFPGFYASAFSGLYLPLIILLWILMVRGFALELRDHLENPFWEVFWDWCFALSSSVGTFFFGAALGNVLRGLPIDRNGYFFLPLWTTLALTGKPGIIDWYTALIGLLVFFALTVYGATWAAFRTDGVVHQRALGAARWTWPVLAALTIIDSALTFAVRPEIPQNFSNNPWGFVFPFFTVAGLSGAGVFAWAGRAGPAFHSAALYLFGMSASVAFGIFPYLLPPYRTTDIAAGLTVYNTAPASYVHWIGLAWFIPGILLVLGYTLYAHIRNAGKIRMEKRKARVSAQIG